MNVLIKIVKYLGDNKLTHRDYSHTNILCRWEPFCVKLIDFGVCTLLNNSSCSFTGSQKFLSSRIEYNLNNN